MKKIINQKKELVPKKEKTKIGFPKIYFYHKN